MEYLQQEVAKLRQLASRKATPERREQVRLALYNKFEGIASVAAQVLGSWADRDSLKLLREFLAFSFGRKKSWSLRGVVIRNLTPHIAPEDREWILDLYFSLPDELSQYEVLALVQALPAEKARTRLVEELSSPNWVNRLAAAKAIGTMPFKDRHYLLVSLEDDPNDRVRDLVRSVAQREPLTPKPE